MLCSEKMWSSLHHAECKSVVEQLNIIHCLCITYVTKMLFSGSNCIRWEELTHWYIWKNHSVFHGHQASVQVSAKCSFKWAIYWPWIFSLHCNDDLHPVVRIPQHNYRHKVHQGHVTTSSSGHVTVTGTPHHASCRILLPWLALLALQLP